MDKKNTRILVSACLLGVNCRYDGKNGRRDEVLKLLREYELIPVCPEILGGLATPRTPAERKGDRVVTKDGADVTKAYERGAKEVLRLARLFGCQAAVLKERSPSCGAGTIYDGTFTGTLTEGNGVCAQMLLDAGIRVLGEGMVSISRGLAEEKVT